MTSVYSPQEDIKAIVSTLFLDGKVGERCEYYNTRRYEYSSASSENGLYFSIDDLRLGERSTPALTLGDLSGYLNRSKLRRNSVGGFSDFIINILYEKILQTVNNQ